MPYDGNGNASLVPSYFVQDGDTVLPVQHNPPFEDIVEMLNQVLLRNGAAPLSGNLNANGNKITNLGTPTANNDPARITELKNRSRFMANKNGTGQTPASGAKITFANEVFDVGSFFDTTLSRWTPEAGTYAISASIGHPLSKADDITLHIYKNGVSIATAVAHRLTVTDGSNPIRLGLTTSVNILAQANGTDYFEVFYTSSSGDPYSIDGQTVRTWFYGHSV